MVPKCLVFHGLLSLFNYTTDNDDNNNDADDAVVPDDDDDVADPRAGQGVKLSLHLRALDPAVFELAVLISFLIYDVD